MEKKNEIYKDLKIKNILDLNEQKHINTYKKI